MTTKTTTLWVSSDFPYGSDTAKLEQLEAQYEAREWHTPPKRRRYRWYWGQVFFALLLLGFVHYYFEQRGVRIEEIKLQQLQSPPEACLATYGAAISWQMQLQLLLYADHRQEECREYLTSINQSAWPNPFTAFLEYIIQLLLLPVIKGMKALGEGLYSITRHHSALMQTVLLVCIPLVLFVAWIKTTPPPKPRPSPSPMNLLV